MSSSENWWLTEYADEIHDYMREKEKQRAVFHMRSSSLRYRSSIINLLSKICDRVKICRPVFHLAVYFLDYYMDHYNISSNQLKLFALGCLLLAAKSEERDGITPTTSELNKFLRNPYALFHYLQVELVLLDFFQWDLVMPTAAHFLEYYIVFAITGNDRHEGRPLSSLAHGKLYISKYSQYFLDLSIMDTRFLSYPPSLVASSCIAASRICLFLTPTWPQLLSAVTFYSSEILGPCIELMLSLLENEEKDMNSKKRKKLCCRK